MDSTRQEKFSTDWAGDDLLLKRDSFGRDLQFADALALVRSLGEAAQAKGRRFGIKLSNTLANINNGSTLPGAERYMSGRALFPITVRLAARIARELPDLGSHISYCGGVSAFNAADLIKAGLGPLTVATDILKPGGYLRLAQIAREAAAALQSAPETTDVEALDTLAAAALNKPEYKKGWKAGSVSISRDLPLYDCFAAPCIEACPVGQKVPGYVANQGQGKSEEALATILSDNPLAHTTGVLCDHVCQEHCSRIDYEGSVRIRDVKLAAARAANIPPSPLPARDTLPAGRTAVIGAGPAGLACAHFLALAGHPVTVFDAGPAPGGVPANVIPRFRIAREEIAVDIDRIRTLGAEFIFNANISSLEGFEEQGYKSFFIGIGADTERNLPMKGSGIKTMGALDFLKRFGEEGPEGLAGLRHILVAGGGNTACDAARAAARIPGIESVRLSYRRTRKEMPADLEELERALAEASSLIPGPEPKLDSKKASHGVKVPAGNSSVLFELSLPEEAKPGAVVLRRMGARRKGCLGQAFAFAHDGNLRAALRPSSSPRSARSPTGISSKASAFPAAREVSLKSIRRPSRPLFPMSISAATQGADLRRLSRPKPMAGRPPFQSSPRPAFPLLRQTIVPPTWTKPSFPAGEKSCFLSQPAIQVSPPGSRSAVFPAIRPVSAVSRSARTARTCI